MHEPRDAEPTAEDLERIRLANRLAVERIRSARLSVVERRTQRQLTESISLDWVTPYAEMLDVARQGRTGDPVFTGPAAYWNRRYGKDWPIHQTEQELALLRAPSRILCATALDAIALVSGVSAYVIGSGYTYRIAKTDRESPVTDQFVRKLQGVVDDILEANDWEGSGQPGVEVEAFWRSLEDGEFLIRNHPQDDGTTEFRLVEPEQLTQPPGSNYYDWLYGVCTDPRDVQQPLAYWIQYGDSPSEGDEVEPELVTHFRRNGRRNQKRGLPDFTFQAYDVLATAGRLRLSLGGTSAKQASIEYVMEHESAVQEDVQAFRDAEADYTVQDPLTGQTSGARRWRRTEGLDIPKGQRYVDGPGPTHAEAHLSILQACQRGAVSRWNGFEWLISANASSNNLPQDLSAESPFVRRVLQEQKRYTRAFRKPVWAALEHWVRTRGFVADGRAWTWDEITREVDLLVEAPSPETRNKQEESQRALSEIEAGVDSPQRFMQSQARDPEQIAADLKAWEAMKPQPAAPQPLPNGQQAGGVDQGEEDGGDPLAVLESLEGEGGDGLRELLEGFTGTVKDKSGRTYHYVNGKRTKAAHVDARRTAHADVEAAVSAAVADPSKVTPAGLKKLAGHLQTLTKDKLQAMARDLRTKAGGTKAQLAGRLLEQIRAGRGQPPATDGPPVLPKVSKAAVSPEASAAMAELFPGRKPADVWAAANATNGADVNAVLDKDGVLTIRANSGAGGSLRQFYRRGKQVVCKNDHFEWNKDAPEAGGLTGTDVFVNQVKALKALGVNKIVTYAAGRPGSQFNGYTTWPKLGYDGTIPKAVFQKLPADVRGGMGDSRSVLKLMSVPGGPEAWKAGGRSMAMHFDLADDSPNMQALARYVAARRAKAGAA